MSTLFVPCNLWFAYYLSVPAVTSTTINMYDTLFWSLIKNKYNKHTLAILSWLKKKNIQHYPVTWCHPKQKSYAALQIPTQHSKWKNQTTQEGYTQEEPMTREYTLHLRNSNESNHSAVSILFLGYSFFISPTLSCHYCSKSADHKGKNITFLKPRGISE